jgi:transcriptional regulator with XRE-family HTH domain
MRGRREVELTTHSATENGLGKSIRAWRHFLSMSVTDLAVHAGFGKNGRGYISKIEHGQIHHLSDEHLERIAKALNLQSVDLLLHRMPESDAETLVYDLDAAIIGGSVVLKVCAKESSEWVLMHLMLAKLYCERAAAAQTVAMKDASLIKAQHCLKYARLVFTANTAPEHFQEAIQLSQEIDEILDASIITGCLALLKRCDPQSLGWACIQMQLAKRYCRRSRVLQGLAARSVLTKAQECIEAAWPIFTQEQAQSWLKEANQLSEKVEKLIKWIDDPEARSKDKD